MNACFKIGKTLESALAECAGGAVLGPREDLFVSAKRPHVLAFLTQFKHQLGNPLAQGVAFGKQPQVITTFHLN